MRIWMLVSLLLIVSCGKKNTDDEAESPTSGSEIGGGQTSVGPQGPAGPHGPAGAPGRDADFVPSQISAKSQTSMVMAAAATYCRDLVESGFDDWHIPTVEELLPFMGIDSDTSQVWTRTTFANSTLSSVYPVVVRLDNGFLQVVDSLSNGKFARCVR